MDSRRWRVSCFWYRTVLSSTPAPTSLPTFRLTAPGNIILVHHEYTHIYVVTESIVLRPQQFKAQKITRPPRFRKFQKDFIGRSEFQILWSRERSEILRLLTQPTIPILTLMVRIFSSGIGIFSSIVACLSRKTPTDTVKMTWSARIFLPSEHSTITTFGSFSSSEIRSTSVFKAMTPDLK